MAEESRPRSSTRARAEAPPGMGLSGAEGQKVIGRYEVIKTIGKGAMGVVYKARDPLLDRVVAVKTIMSPQQSGRRVRSAFLERFQREAKAAAKMSHPAIVTIFDVGVDEASGAPFMVLEYLPGESLADRLDRVRLPLARCVSIGLDLSSALSFAHRQRIVHRDVKPANVLHAGDNRWKLADFGIARLPDSDLTQVGIFMGTPGYSPPEAIREGRYTPQADVFAWGAVMYELMCGRIPYEGPDTKTTNGYVVQGNAAPPTRHDPSIPEPLAAVAMTALQPSDKVRFKDAGEAEAALRDAWDRCLTQGLVHPAVLAMDELQHDKVPARMHEPRGVVRPAPPPVQVEALLVESQQRLREDDDPTRLMVRDEKAKDKAKADPTRHGVGAIAKTPARPPFAGEPPGPPTRHPAPEPGLLPIVPPPPADVTTGDTVSDVTPMSESDAIAAATPPEGAPALRVASGVETAPVRKADEAPPGMSRALMIAIAVLLLAGSTAAGLYLGGVLR